MAKAKFADKVHDRCNNELHLSFEWKWIESEIDVADKVLVYKHRSTFQVEVLLLDNRIECNQLIATGNEKLNLNHTDKDSYYNGKHPQRRMHPSERDDIAVRWIVVDFYPIAVSAKSSFITNTKLEIYLFFSVVLFYFSLVFIPYCQSNEMAIWEIPAVQIFAVFCL